MLECQVTYKVQDVALDRKHKPYIRTKTHKIMLPETIKTVGDADEYLNWGGPGNKIIENHVYDSLTNSLINWWVIKVDSPCSLAANRVLKWLPKVHKKTGFGKLVMPDFEHNQGWLDPSGKWYPVFGFANHNRWAWDYLQERYGLKEAMDRIEYYRFGGTATDYLHDQGWIRVLNWTGEGGYSFQGYSKPNERQRKTLIQFCITYKIDIDKIDNELQNF